MMTLLINGYLTTLIAIGLFSLSIFLIGLYFIFKTKHISQPIHLPMPTLQEEMLEDEMPQDFSAIAGDDVMATQLDLARAYIETGKKHDAKSILETVAKQGSVMQREEAERLLVFVFSG